VPSASSVRRSVPVGRSEHVQPSGLGDQAAITGRIGYQPTVRAEVRWLPGTTARPLVTPTGTGWGPLGRRAGCVGRTGGHCRACHLGTGAGRARQRAERAPSRGDFTASASAQPSEFSGLSDLWTIARNPQPTHILRSWAANAQEPRPHLGAEFLPTFQAPMHSGCRPSCSSPVPRHSRNPD
jgi:hypothetical protein